MIHWTVPMARAFAEQPELIEVGAFRGRTLLKRRFYIQVLRIVAMGAALSSYGEGGVVTGDPFLGRVLAMAGERAGSIIRTIGRQQSEAIFDRVPLLVVHGVPGSGKTQIGQMRVAYLVTDAATDPSHRLRADACLILSPSTALVEYMEAVLPSFGVRGVRQESVDGWLADYAGVPLPLSPSDPGRGGSEFSSSQEAWLAARVQDGLDRLRAATPPAGQGWGMEPADLAEAAAALSQDAYDEMRRALRERIGRPAKERALKSLGVGWDESDKTRYGQIEGAIDGAAVAFVDRHLPPLGPREAHLALLKALGAVPSLGRDDLPALAYWQLLITGRRMRGLYHVVVDEGQNVAPLAYRVLRRVVPQATFTVLGDLAQRDPLLGGLSDWQELASLGFGEPLVRYLGINYRSTPAIVALLNVLGPRMELPFRPIEPVDREAPPVVAVEIAEGLDMAQAAVRLLQALPRTTAAILCADPRRSPAVAALVAAGAFAQGREPFVGTRTEAAGLEFDLVLVLDADAKTLPRTPAAASDLFVLASRAQNRVLLLHQGPLTPLAQGATIVRAALTHLEETEAAAQEVQAPQR
jgi:DNA helicase-2/ATP-dependent DNA helicase PcrA